MGFCTPIVLARVRFFLCFPFFFLFFVAHLFPPAVRLASYFPKAIIFDRLFGGETTLNLRLERPYYTPYYVNAFLH